MRSLSNQVAEKLRKLWEPKADLNEMNGMAQRFFRSLLSDPLLQAPLIQTDKILCQAFFREAAQSELRSKTTHTLRKQGTSDQVGQRPSHHRRFPPAQKDAVV